MATATRTVSRSAVRRRFRSTASLIRFVRRHAATLFNRGLAEASAGIHAALAGALLSGRRRLPPALRQELRAALRDARVLSTATARAWRLGTTLDRVAAALARRPTPVLALARSEPGSARCRSLR